MILARPPREHRAVEGLAGLAHGPSPSRLQLCDQQTDLLRRLAELSYPFEACGLLLGRTRPISASPASAGSEVRRVERVIQASNLSGTTNRRRFVLDPRDFFAARRSAERAGQRILGVWHTHPDQPAVPSLLDLEAAWAEHSQLIVSIDALGDTVVRSWRLDGDGFVVEPIWLDDAARSGARRARPLERTAPNR